MDDWESMLFFALELINQSKRHIGTDANGERITDIYGQRIMILHLDHANELLMKAYLTKKDYVIEYFNHSDLEKGLTKEKSMRFVKTLGYSDCLNIVSKLVHFAQQKKDVILDFHKIRNEIQHRSIDLPLRKEEEIARFYPTFKELYTLMFPQYADEFPTLNL